MFKEVVLSETQHTNEAEFSGYAEAGSVIKFNRLLDWMKNVKASQNAKYLKCINNKASKVTVFNISDVKFSENLVHKHIAYEAGVKIAYKEDATAPAMDIATAAELFEKIEQLCIENGKDPSTIEVFTEDVNGKLSRFSWYYDDATDTAVIVRNMNLRQASDFLHNGADVIIRKLAQTPTNPDKLLNQLEVIEKKMAALKTKQDEVLKKMSDMPDQTADDQTAIN